MTTTINFDASANLYDICTQCHADVRSITTILELIGSLSYEQAQRVLYQASIAAAAEKIATGKNIEP